jgi:hypothetical protein
MIDNNITNSPKIFCPPTEDQHHHHHHHHDVLKKSVSNPIPFACLQQAGQ